MNIRRLVAIIIVANVALLGASAYLISSNTGWQQEKHLSYSRGSAPLDSSAPMARDATGREDIAVESRENKIPLAEKETNAIYSRQTAGASGTRRASEVVPARQVEKIGDVRYDNATQVPGSNQGTGNRQAGTVTGQPAAQTVVGNASEAKPPLAFSDTSGLKLNAAQQQQIANLQQNFVNAVGDPSSADYYSRWQTAQWQSDEEFKQQFGWQAFIQQQLAASHHQGTALTNP